MEQPLNAISLFSGIGGFELAAQLINKPYQTFQFVEINPHAQKVLQFHFPNVPIWGDIKTYHPPKPKQLGFPTVIVGGFPCTNTSGAGKKQGLAGNESGLWWEMYRVILECRPDFVIIENPIGLIERGLRTILGAFTLAGYQTEIEIISASELGAPHQRQRVFIIAYTNNLSIRQREKFCCWSESIGTDIETAREIRERSQIESGSVSVDDVVPDYLAGVHYDHWWKRNSPPVISGLRRRLFGRREAVSLAGRAIVPIQATIPLLRLQFLASLIT